MTGPPAPFIVGVPRSGTTLLRLLFDAHPELAIPPETGFGSLAASFAGTTPERDALLAALTALPTWQDLGFDQDDIARTFASVRPWSVGAGLRACFVAYAARHGKSRWGDKTPGHVDYMESLSHVLPEARFIHLIRDGRDVAASLRGLPFAPGDGSIRAIAAVWRDTIARARRAGARLPHYREVRYERLVTEPEATLRELCDLVELPFDRAMLRGHERSGERLAELRSAELQPGGAVRFADGTVVTSRTRHPPDPTRAGRWRHTLTEHDLALFEELAGGALAAEGYELSFARARAGDLRGSERDRSAPMMIVVGTRALVGPGGTETSVTSVARELDRLGHDVIVTAEELGPFAEAAERDGIRITAEPDLPERCDAVLAHDATMTAVLAARYPAARVVFVAHSEFFDPQMPVQLPGVIDAVVACSDRLAARIRALALDVPIVRLREPIATDRFATTTTLPERPRRALILSNYLHGAQRRALLDAWEPRGIEFTEVGGASTPLLDPRGAIEDADIVVAKARAALEAMCLGRAVYLYDQFGGDGWVTPDSYPAMEADNFAGQATPRPRTAADLAADLALYRPDMGRVNHELVRTHHGARRHAHELVAVMRGSHGRTGDGGHEALAEVARLTRAAWHGQHRQVELEHQVSMLRERASGAELQLAEAREMLGTRRVRAGITLGRALDRLRGRR